MRVRTLACLLVLGLTPLAGCTAEVTSGGSGELVVDQTRFDFTAVDDRNLFAESGLAFEGTVGPYAIYEVTGDDPRLVGPRVRYNRNAAGLVMLCGASAYFSPDGDRGDDVEVTLLGGPNGDRELTASRVEAITVEDCSNADDKFSERVPDPEEEEMIELYSTYEERVVVGFDPAPEVGSRVLLRMVALDVPARDHNDAPTVPSVCCDGDFCTLN